MNIEHIIIVVSCLLALAFMALYIRELGRRREITCELNNRGEVIFDEDEVSEVLANAQYNRTHDKVIITIVKP